VALAGGGVTWRRSMILHARTSEAREGLGRLGVAAAAAHKRDGRVCPSASRAVPEQMPANCGNEGLTGMYTSHAADWTVDKAHNAGFACLGFEMARPQYYRYEYSATNDSFVARARTCVPDLVSDGAFEIRGHVEGGQLVVGQVIRIRK
jgi:hypothetical protein